MEGLEGAVVRGDDDAYVGRGLKARENDGREGGRRGPEVALLVRMLEQVTAGADFSLLL